MIYDQQSATNRMVSGGGSPFQAEQPAGQSFTPTLSSVGFVQFEFADPHPGDGVGATVYLNLRADSLSGPELGSTDPVSMPDGFFWNVTNFFFAVPVAVTPGTTYYLQPVLQSGDSLWTIVNGPFPYSGGTFFFNGAPDPYGFNTWFREGVLTPEPHSGLLLLASLASLWMRRRLRLLKRGRVLLVLALTGAVGVCTASASTTQTDWVMGYFSRQHPEWPPLPDPPVAGSPQYRANRGVTGWKIRTSTMTPCNRPCRHRWGPQPQPRWQSAQPHGLWNQPVD